MCTEVMGRRAEKRKHVLYVASIVFGTLSGMTYIGRLLIILWRDSSVLICAFY